jgi:DMSO reductase anchor subunit
MNPPWSVVVFITLIGAGQAPSRLRAVKHVFLLLVFALPAVLVAPGRAEASAALLGTAFAVQSAGLLAERWFFVAQAWHPQNLYYRAAA